VQPGRKRPKERKPSEKGKNPNVQKTVTHFQHVKKRARFKGKRGGVHKEKLDSEEHGRCLEGGELESFSRGLLREMKGYCRGISASKRGGGNLESKKRTAWQNLIYQPFQKVK